MGTFKLWPISILFCAVTLASGAAQAQNQYTAISGTIKDDQGNPLANISINYMPRVKKQMDSQSRTMSGFVSEHQTDVSDSQGSFTLHMLKDSEGIVFANTDELVTDYKILDDPTVSIDLVLRHNGQKLAGTVLDADGNPVPGALIGIAANTKESGNAPTGGPWRFGLAGAGMLQATADANGHFEVDKLPALPLVVWSAKAGDKASLQKNYQFSAKQSNVDLHNGNVLDLKIQLDPPDGRSARQVITEHDKRIDKIREATRQHAEQAQPQTPSK